VLYHQELIERLVGLAIEVHRHSGPGLLESFYVAARWSGGIRVRREVGIPAMYKGKPLMLGFRADILVDETVVLEIKGVPTFLPLHDTQFQTYLHLSGLPVGLLFNFHALRLKDGLRRFVGGWTRFSVAHRGPRSASVSKNPWPDTHLRSERRDTRQRYNV
jgi:GxxExxY protein